VGTVYDLLGSLSQVTPPLDATLTNLYWNVVPAGKLTVALHLGLLLVYCDADSAGAAPTSQLPSCEMEPTILMVWPTLVVTRSLKVTATVAAGVQLGLAVMAVVLVVVRVVLVAGLVDDEDDDTGGFGVLPLPPVMRMSAQLTYICAVWKLFHRNERRVWLDT